MTCALLKPKTETPVANFFKAWQSAVWLADYRFFAGGTASAVEMASCVMDLPPNIQLIKSCWPQLSLTQKRFIAVMVAFYDPEAGDRMLKELQFNLFNAATAFDFQRRKAIADLLRELSPMGWF